MKGRTNSFTMVSSLLSTLLLLLNYSPNPSFAFTLPNANQITTGRQFQLYDINDIDSERPLTSRRKALTTFLSTALVGALPKPVYARDELFKPNPLTNGFLEQIRIWEQAEADNVQYGGELTPGSPKGRESYAKLLVPILQIQSDLSTLSTLVHRPDGTGLQEADAILSRPYFEKIRFKKIFNAFADNIYYSDPDRANAYLGGGATPKNEQSIAYLLRNDILTNVEDLRAEVAYLLKERRRGNVEEEVEDLYMYVRVAGEGMVKYLDLVPPSELKLAREMFGASGGDLFHEKSN